ncbi:prepilin-type N-terminal cleavage/methylation domain-containing protein [Pseudoalteromonas sp. NEC-BIFX-2020_002]|uniref:prepilin-type N-terminal cleavage/methylation domain-containing protein n=1 Tax=unclassified Pseudoalteromonas TaxID=194690 RepID=UPI0014613417|nr:MULTISPECIES: prepilin-type N-terminal cleavage/methylation domain-containing protein [unclassified Pseudoalteromonas]NMR25032.1 prepilin-type N-terminal cleavage/methylation domain-containing protein [Pseudoalteromonas sp. NEC-BIFX-2020_015]NNG43560.1 prepilin-type N-terminal cleavage/methylation domain-containing protein [Pseudoalteromonas sp. NEC-BIFX-2020_002]
MLNMAQHNNGFSLFEMVLVVILLAVVMSVAVPQFMNVKEQAHSANIDAVAGGFASAVGFVRGQWELEARPKGSAASRFVTYINYGGVVVGVDGETGTPTSDETEQKDTRALAMSSARCQQVLNVILQDAPSSTLSSTVSEVKDVRFLVRYDADALQCIYYLSHSLDAENIPKNGKQLIDTKGFSYFPKIGKVQIFKS